MKNVPKISIVIPTYNRPIYLEKIIDKLSLSNISNEILICDGGSKLNSKNKIKKLIIKYNFHNIKYFDVGVNNHSKKRNKGIKSASGKYIILLDDDCVPEKKFLEKYFLLLEKYKHSNNFFCGSVLFPKNLMKKKFIQFRQSRHFVIKKNQNYLRKILHPRNIVTMNMAFKKKSLEDKKIFFYEKFNIYGFEDYEFGYRLRQNNINIVACDPLVYHHDERSFKKYLDKIKFVGYEGGDYLVKLNKKASLENNFIKIQNNFIIKYIKKFNFFYKVLSFVEKRFIYLENKISFPNFLYQILTANAYLIGHLMPKNKKNDKIFSGWYK